MDLSKLTPPYVQVSRELRAAQVASPEGALAQMYDLSPPEPSVRRLRWRRIRDISLSLSALLLEVGAVGRHATR